ncbi:MAG: hypothetical protein DMF84_06200 [Acidobacteria bacterium]|nr:MAG: hypothetical protein DMF84_06200 [Acidobacteriota bacterium]
MTKTFWLGVIAFGLLTWTVGCARDNPAAPSDLNLSAAQGPLSELTTTSYPIVTLQPDLTADPPLVTVRAGDPVLMINNSAQFVRIRSSNCSEFSAVWLNPGASKHTWPFSPAGKKCDYFVWNWPDRVFEGQIAVN